MVAGFLKLLIEYWSLHVLTILFLICFWTCAGIALYSMISGKAIDPVLQQFLISSATFFAGGIVQLIIPKAKEQVSRMISTDSDKTITEISTK